MENRSTSVLILGMHRSGTSSLAGTLQEQGVYLGQVYESNPYNKKGNRENPDIMQLNNKILEHNNSSWSSPPHSIVWTIEHKYLGQKILAKFLESDQRVWGFKDPRTLFTLEFWLDELKNSSTAKFVAIFRHPISVAQSLKKRDQLPIVEGIKLWETYNTRLYEIHQKVGFPVVSFDVESTEYFDAIRRAIIKLRLPYENMRNHHFFDESLRHNVVDHSISIPKSALILYEKLQSLYEEQV